MRAADGDEIDPGPGGRRRLLCGRWVAPLVGVACFANTLGNGFVYDDHYIVAQGHRLASPANLREIWLADWWWPISGSSESDPRRDRLYRPLTLFSFALNYRLNAWLLPQAEPRGLQPWSFHLVNVLLHGLVCLLVWHFAWRLTGDQAVAGPAAILFAVHPVHVEAVTGIVGRAELLGATFMLCGLLVLMSEPAATSLKRTLLATPMFLAALLAKETAVCYPLVGLLVLAAVQGRRRWNRRGWTARAAILLLPLVIYLPLRYLALEHRLIRSGPADGLLNPLADAPTGQRLLGAFTVLGHYTRLLLWPANLSCDYGLAVIKPAAGPTAMTLLGGLASLGLLLGLLGLLQAKPFWRRVGYLTAMWLASYLLVSNTFLLIGVAVAERLMYWPSVPAVILIAAAVMKLWRGYLQIGQAGGRRAALWPVLGVLLIGVLVLRTVIRNRDWQSNLSLSARDVAAHPESACLNRAYALALAWLAEELPEPTAQAEALRTAERHLTAALEIAPLFSEALSLRARIRAHFGQTEAARRDAEAALLVNAGNTAAMYVLNQLEGDLPALRQQVTELTEQVQQRPDDPGLRLALGRALCRSGQPAAAREHLERAAALAPENAEVLVELANVLALTGHESRAIQTLRQALRLAPDDWRVHTGLAWLLMRSDPATALTHAQQARRLNPADVSVAMALGQALAANRRSAEALQVYEQTRRGLGQQDPLCKVIEAQMERLRTAGRGS